MGTEVPKTQDSSGDTDNSESENSSSSASSRSEWECFDSEQSPNLKAHFSVTSCDTGLKLKIAAIPPRKVSPKRTAKPAVKKKITQNKTQNKDKSSLKKKSQLSDTTSSSDSCSKCSSDSSSDDDIPLKTVSKNLPSKCSKTPPKAKPTNKSDNDEGKKQCDVKDNNIKTNKDKQSATKIINVKKTKSEDSNQDTTLKRGRGRPRAKLSEPALC